MVFGRRKVLKIGIVGSRTFEEYTAMSNYIKEKINLDDYNTVVSGGAVGADNLAERFARDNSLAMVVHYPEWNRFGNNAGFIRNSKIVEESDVIFAFWDGRSRGTHDTIDKAKRMGKPIHIFTFGH